MKTSLDSKTIGKLAGSLGQANASFMKVYPGESEDRQPVHTVYGGAHLFKSTTAKKLGELSLKFMDQFALDFVMFNKALHIVEPALLPSGPEILALVEKHHDNPENIKNENNSVWLIYTVYQRVMEKLKREAVEDFRIDFEDGYGNRPDDEEDATAVQAAQEVAKGMKDGILPPFIGIRIKPLTEELYQRSLRTLDIFLTTLGEQTGGKLPDNFIITLPKVVIVEQAEALVEALNELEIRTSFAHGSLKIELMIEMTQTIVDTQGRFNIPLIVKACGDRCRGAHFGTYDYTASCNITAAYQTMMHPACDFARLAMINTLSNTGLMISDGATNVMPIAPHRAKDGEKLTSSQIEENNVVVHKAWKLAFDHVVYSLKIGFYQGWDLHPGQLPIRYAAMYKFFLEGLHSASDRLKNFIEVAAQATLVGDVFDDAATGQGLLNFFLRALSCGAIAEEDVLATGLSLEGRSRSFAKIMKERRN